MGSVQQARQATKSLGTVTERSQDSYRSRQFAVGISHEALGSQYPPVFKQAMQLLVSSMLLFLRQV